MHFVRGMAAAELALRMGTTHEARVQPITDTEVAGLAVDADPGRGPRSAVLRVGEHAG